MRSPRHRRRHSLPSLARVRNLFVAPDLISKKSASTLVAESSTALAALSTTTASTTTALTSILTGADAAVADTTSSVASELSTSTTAAASYAAGTVHTETRARPYLNFLTCASGGIDLSTSYASVTTAAAETSVASLVSSVSSTCTCRKRMIANHPSESVTFSRAYFFRFARRLRLIRSTQ